MVQSGQSSRIKATESGLQKLKETKNALRSDDGQRLTYKHIAEKSYISESRVKGFFRGEGVYTTTALEICNVLGLKLEDVVDRNELGCSTETTEPEQITPINWREVCRNRLDEQNQRSLTTNPLTRKDGIEFELDEIYVDLTLEKRPKREKQKDNFLAKQGWELDEPTEEKRKYQKKDFFDKVLTQLPKQGNSKGRRIAIIGEAGAGKSTYQQKIGEWVLENTETDVPILVSLAAIGNKPLNKYLSEDWLRDAAQKLDKAPPEWKASFEELLKSGRVWLLLDGADEMAVTHPLKHLAEQLKEGWIQNVQVVLTCRLNIWDAGKNALEGFDTYRTLNFSYGDANTPNQVGEFIDNWFKSSPNLGNQLFEALEQPQKRQIKDTVKNPLLLALLCYNWQIGDGTLPDTKAELYQQFVDKFYEWKQEIFPTTREQREQLNQALGELALKAISEQSSRVHMRENFVREVLKKQEPEMFKLAIDLSWLKSVGVTAEQPCEQAYAFFHTTFQEYFAALAVKDWHVFLNHTPEDLKQGTYRIFEPQWKEVILFWLGRKNVPTQEKENFFEALVEFSQKGSDFYFAQSLFLAAAGIAEFSELTLIALFILMSVARLAFGYLDINTGKWIVVPTIFAEKAKATLLETDFNLVFVLLKYLMETITSEYDYIRLEIALYLWENFIDSPEIIKFVIQLMCGKTGGQLMYHQINYVNTNTIKDKFIDIASGNSVAIAILIQLIEANKSKDKDFALIAIYWLGKIGNKYPEAIDFLNKLINTTHDNEISKQATAILREITEIEEGYYFLYPSCVIYPKTTEDVANLINLLDTEKNEDRCCEAIFKLAYTKGNLDATSKALNNVLNSSIKSEQIRYEAASGLRHLEPDNPIVICTFTELINTTQNTTILYYSLSEVYCINNYSYEQLLVFGITKLISISKSYKEIHGCIEELLWELEIGFGDPDVIDALTEKVRASHQDEKMRIKVALGLAVANPGNSEAFQAILDILLTTHEDNLIEDSIFNLRRICEKYEEYEEQMGALVERLDKTKDEIERWKLAAVLLMHGPSQLKAVTILNEAFNKTQDKNIRLAIVANSLIYQYGEDERIDALIYLLRHNQDSEICEWVSRQLNYFIPVREFTKVVTALKNYAQDNPHGNQRDYLLYSGNILWHCAQNMSYTDFCSAWHDEPNTNTLKAADTVLVGGSPTTQALENQITDIASQLQPTDKTYPIVINTQALEGETETSAIAQELCNQIYLTAFPHHPEIPEVSNVPQLKRLIPQIKKQLQIQNLVLILDKCTPNQEQVTFYQKLSDVLHIAWVTNEPIEPPLQGFLPNQSNLLSALQSWLYELC